MKTVADNVVKHSLTSLSVQKWLVGDVRLNVNFALSEPPSGVAALLQNLTNTILYLHAIIRMEHEITNNVH